MWWLLSTQLVWASDVYSAELADGTLVFTDSPVTEGYDLLFSELPLNPEGRVIVNTRTYPTLDTWDDVILLASRRYGVEAELIKAVCIVESGMNPSALSYAGAMGLMQLMPGTAGDLGVDDPYDPELSIDGGTRYLRQMAQIFGNRRHVLAAYNAGPGAVKRYKGIPPYKQTQLYVTRVLDVYDTLKRSRPVRPELESAPIEN